MDRRLYFLIPDVMHAERLERQLVENGVSRRNMHAVARESVAINHLPKSSELQQHDIANKVESWLWGANLVLFFIALAIALVLILFQSPFWVLIPIAFMLVSFYAGFRFASEIPNTHMNELSAAIRHGEEQLMLDVPKRRVREIERLLFVSVIPIPKCRVVVSAGACLPCNYRAGTVIGLP